MSEKPDDRDPPAARPRAPAGLRPAYLGDGTGDRLLYMLMALTAEFSALREEVEDLRRFLNADRDALARFLQAHPRDEAEQADARRRREDLLDAMFRILREDFALEGDERMLAYLRHMDEVAGR